jgi:hypothetical protein
VTKEIRVNPRSVSKGNPRASAFRERGEPACIRVS